MDRADLEQLISFRIKMQAGRGTQPVDTAQADILATTLLDLSVRKFGRINSVAFNRDKVSFTLTSGTSSYKIGDDILTKYPAIWNMQYMYVTDNTGQRIDIIGLDRFNDYRIGNTDSGVPLKATIHSKNKQLEFYPTPSSDLTVIGYAKENLDKLEEIPTMYWDAVVAYAFLLVSSIEDPTVSNLLYQDNKKDMQEDSQTLWDGDQIEQGFHIGLGADGIRNKSDKFNTMGE